jgi:single-stranded DNA-binding protein
MRSFSEFQIIGRVGKLKEVGPTLRISIASEYGRKDDRGEFQQNTFWNEVTLFNEATITWANANIRPGDIVHARGTIRQSQWEAQDGSTVYGVTLAAEQVDDFSHDERRRAEAAVVED